jgi:hypothetical protein
MDKKKNILVAQTTLVIVWAAVHSVSVSTIVVVSNSNLPYKQWLAGVVVIDVVGR